MATEAERTKAACEVLGALSDVIRALGSVPSGHLYARVMGLLTLDQYNRLIDILKDSGIVTETNHVLTWVEKK